MRSKREWSSFCYDEPWKEHTSIKFLRPYCFILVLVWPSRPRWRISISPMSEGWHYWVDWPYLTFIITVKIFVAFFTISKCVWTDARIKRANWAFSRLSRACRTKMTLRAFEPLWLDRSFWTFSRVNNSYFLKV